MARWPDQRKILRYALAPFGTVVGTLTVDWEKRVTAEKPLLHLVKVGTSDVGELERTDRLKVDVYGRGETAALDVAEDVLSFLVGHYHYVPDQEDLGLIDDVSVDVGPTPVPQYQDGLALVSATYRLVARPLA